MLNIQSFRSCPIGTLFLFYHELVWLRSVALPYNLSRDSSRWMPSINIYSKIGEAQYEAYAIAYDCRRKRAASIAKFKGYPYAEAEVVVVDNDVNIWKLLRNVPRKTWEINPYRLEKKELDLLRKKRITRRYYAQGTVYVS